MKLHLIAGARPNFMKIAPIIHAIHDVQKNSADINYRLIYNGQHYDEKMSDTFLRIKHPYTGLQFGLWGRF